MTTELWEKVHTVGNYHDGPVSGVADVDGVPHLYEKVFSEEEDEYIDRYAVRPIDQELYSLLIESWSIFIRWRTAFDQGQVGLETYPALPENRDRHHLLEKAIANRVNMDTSQSRQVGGRFRRTGPGMFAWEVQWLD